MCRKPLNLLPAWGTVRLRRLRPMMSLFSMTRSLAGFLEQRAHLKQRGCLRKGGSRSEPRACKCLLLRPLHERHEAAIGSRPDRAYEAHPRVRAVSRIHLSIFLTRQVVDVASVFGAMYSLCGRHAGGIKRHLGRDQLGACCPFLFRRGRLR